MRKEPELCGFLVESDVHPLGGVVVLVAVAALALVAVLVVSVVNL